MRGDGGRTENLGAGREERGGGVEGRATDRPFRVRAGAAELRPRGVGDLLDMAVELVTARFLLLTGTAMVVWMPTIWLERRLTVAVERGQAHDLVVDILPLLTSILAGVVTSAATSLATIPWLRGEPMPAGAFARLLRALPALFFVTFTTMAAIVVGVFPCVVPAVYLWWRLLLAPVAAVIEAPRPLRALRRSWALTTQGFRRWLGLYAASVALVLPFGIAGQFVLDGTFELYLIERFPELGASVTELVLVLLGSLVSAVPSALGAAALTVFFVDQLVRHEAWDLFVRLEDLERRAPAAAAYAAVPDAGGLG